MRFYMLSVYCAIEIAYTSVMFEITVIVENFVVWKFLWLPPSTKIMPTKLYVQRIQ